MVRRLIISSLAATLLVGCGRGLPSANLTTERQHLGDMPPPMVTTIPGVIGETATVSLQPTLNVTAVLASRGQDSASAVVASDSEIEAVDLIAEAGGSYAVKGWFTDLKDTFKRFITRWRLKSEIRAALKHHNDEAFNLHEGEIDNQKKNRTAPITKISNLGGGNQDIVTTWNSTYKGDYRIQTDRVIDADGVTQVLTVLKTGTTEDGLALELTRARTLEGADGSYKVVTDKKVTFKDGRKQTDHWIKSVKTDGSETIDGYIDTPDNWRTEMTGKRGIDGKVKLEVSKIAPWHNPGATPDPAATSVADPAATGED
jgi:hypothetical protein